MKTTPPESLHITYPGLTRRAVATFLSYTIDPALTLVSSTVVLVGNTALALVASPFALVYFMPSWMEIRLQSRRTARRKETAATRCMGFFKQVSSSFADRRQAVTLEIPQIDIAQTR